MDIMAEVTVVFEVVVGAGCGGKNRAAVVDESNSESHGFHGAVGSGRGCVGLLTLILSTVWLPFRRTIPISTFQRHFSLEDFQSRHETL